MKKTILFIVLFVTTGAAYAQFRPSFAPEVEPHECDYWREYYQAPYYFCDCEEKSIDYTFPMVLTVKDTMWFAARIEDLMQGLSAYWFSECPVTMEAYAFCTSKEPTISFTIGGNQMREMDAQKVKEKMQSQSESAQALIGQIIPHVRIYPNEKGCEGKVYCSVYDEGPRSQCDDPLPFYPRMAYVVDTTENVYRMEYTSLPTASYGYRSFVRWKQKDNLPCEIWLTLDSCTGDTIDQAILSDSLHVYQPNRDSLKRARTEQHSVWIHVRHAQGATGRIYWYNNPKPAKEPLPAVDEQICTGIGKSITVDFQSYTKDTAFTDTLWVKSDTLSTRTVSIQFMAPPVEYDTVYMNDATIKSGYVEQSTGQVFYAYGDYTITIEKKDECTRIRQLAIKREEIPTICDQPQTLSVGSGNKCNLPEHVYRLEDSFLSESGNAFILWKHKNSKPCEIWVTLDSCTGQYVGYTTLSDSLHIFLLDTTLLRYAKEDHHSVWVYTKHAAGVSGNIFWYNDAQYADALPRVDEQPCVSVGQSVTVDMHTYTSDTTYTDTLWVKGNTLTTREVQIAFVPLAIEYDTVNLTDDEIKQGYTEAVSNKRFYKFGDYTIKVEKKGQCTRTIQLAIIRKEPDIPTAVDTTDLKRLNVRKQLINGQLYIIIDESIYTLTGQKYINN